jgi:hypothetical protein
VGIGLLTIPEIKEKKGVQKVVQIDGGPGIEENRKGTVKAKREERERRVNHGTFAGMPTLQRKVILKG